MDYGQATAVRETPMSILQSMIERAGQLRDETAKRLAGREHELEEARRENLTASATFEALMSVRERFTNPTPTGMDPSAYGAKGNY